MRRLVVVIALCMCACLADKPPNPALGKAWKTPPVSVKPFRPEQVRSGDAIARPPQRILEEDQLYDNVFGGCVRSGILLREPGVIQSPNYPNNYPRNLNCKYFLQAPENQIVVVMITDFLVRCGGDYLRLWAPGSPVKMNKCRNGNQPMIDQFYVSESNRLNLRFKTNRNKFGRGFSLLYWFQDREQPCSDNVATLTAPSGVIQHPSVFEGQYDNNENCTWLISAPPDKWIRLYLHQIDVEEDGDDCPYDRLSVFYGSTMYDQVAVTAVCGAQAPNDSLLVPSSSAVVNFNSDSSVNHLGFTGSYEFTDGVPACGMGQPQVLTNMTGTIAVDYAEEYDNDLTCTWDISIPSPQYGIELTVNFFHVEESYSSDYCAYDGLQIMKDNTTYVDSWCGYIQAGHTLLIYSNKVQITFYSDDSVVEAGFSINYRAVNTLDMPTTTPMPTTTTASGGNTTQPPVDSDQIGLYFDQGVLKQGECGVPAISPMLMSTRIVGGSEAVPHSYPWIVSMKSTSHYCGATILAERWVITAAHCVIGDSPGDINLVLGEHHLMQPETPPSITIGVEAILMHAGYNDYTLLNDIALLYTDRPITFTDVVWPACLPTQDYPTNEPACVIAGWGETEGTGNYRSLRYAQVPILDTSTCTGWNWEYDPNEIYGSMFCAGYEQGGIDTCQGDSGGPLVCPHDDGSWYLHGITSWGYGCADTRSPGIYTRVTSHYSWIEGTMLTHK